MTVKSKLITLPVPVRSGSGSGGIWAGTGSCPVDLAGTNWYRDFFSQIVFKVAKRNVENIYSLKSENVEILLFMKYNLRFLNFRY